jgi:hypothetical protein
MPVVALFDHIYIYGAVPADAVAVAVPFMFAQFAGVVAVAADKEPADAVTAAVAVVAQKLASVTVTV